jgi:acetolactate synthase-1/2/3 large subunit
VLAAGDDDGFLMSVQELETAIRAKTNFVALVFEDSGFGVIKWKQLKRYGRPAFVDFGNPNFAALAESFGCRGYRVTAAQELQPIFEEAFRQPVPAVVACPVDYGENLRLREKLGAWCAHKRLCAKYRKCRIRWTRVSFRVQREILDPSHALGMTARGSTVCK